MSRSRILSITAALALAATPALAAAHDEGGGHSRGHHGQRHHGHHHHHRLRHHVAGTISSFSDGVLTIALADGSTRAAKVTDRTRIVCPPAGAAARASRHGNDDPSGDDGPRGPGSRGRGDDDGPSHDAQDDDHPRGSHCDSSSLVRGAIVRHAFWVGPATDAVWRKVVVVAAP